MRKLSVYLATPKRQAVFLTLFALLWLISLQVTMGTAWEQLVVATMPFVFSLIFFKRCWRLAISSRKEFMRWEMRLIKSWRAYAKPAPIVQLVQSLSIALAAGSATLLFAGLENTGQVGITSAGILLAVAGLCEIAVLTSRVLQYAWAPFLGKVITLVLGGVLTALSVVFAKQAVHEVLNIDPKYFSELVVIGAAIFLPLVFLTAVAGFVAIYAFFQLWVFGLLILADTVLVHVKPFSDNGVLASVRMYWYRIRNGRRPPGRVMAEAGLLPEHRITLIASALSKIAVAVILFKALGAVTQVLPDVRPYLARVVVELEYRTGSSCANIDPALPVAYMENGWVSVARREGENYRFEIETCSFQKESGK